MNPQDMRYRLLAHYLNPTSDVGGAPDWSRCESEFEVDVGKLIQARGYRVLVQYEPLGPSGLSQSKRYWHGWHLSSHANH